MPGALVVGVLQVVARPDRTFSRSGIAVRWGTTAANVKRMSTTATDLDVTRFDTRGSNGPQLERSARRRRVQTKNAFRQP